MSTVPRQELDAVYERGVFRPLAPALVAEGETVHLVVEPRPGSRPETLDLLLRVYEGLSSEEIAGIERIALDRSGFKVPPANP